MRACAALARAGLNLFYPGVCIGCGRLPDGELAHLCSQCAAQLRPAPAPAVFALAGAPRLLVHGLKYGGERHLSSDIEILLRRRLEFLEQIRGAVLVPVPLHPRRERERGFNQSELIAEAFRRAAGRPTRVERLLRRTEDTPTQTGLDRERRGDNLKNAFAVAGGATFNANVRYLVVDDVLTTGATLESCARALARSGCETVGVAAFARG
jgi:ComF family protein